MYKNGEGYPDPTQGEGLRRAQHLPENIWKVVKLIRDIAGISKLNLVKIEVEDRKTKRKYLWTRSEEE